MAASRSLLTRVTLLSLRYSFTLLASSAGLGVALARDLVLACIQNSEHVGLSLSLPSRHGLHL